MPRETEKQQQLVGGKPQLLMLRGVSVSVHQRDTAELRK